MSPNIKLASKLTRKRVNIVNPHLCDIVLQRLKPSLEQYIGCTIIDINPGVGLFSQKLHDYLRPRNHVLFEPMHKHFGEFLNPLLDAPGSRYCIRDWSDEHRWEEANYIQEGLTPDAEGSGGSPPTTECPNNLTLIVGNLIKPPSVSKTPYMPATTSSQLPSRKALNFARKVRQSAGSPNAAPARMLLWMGNTDKYSIIPRSVVSRNRVASLLEAFCHVEEIVGASSRTTMRREDALDRRSMERVAERMRKSGIKVPEGNPAGPINTDLKLSSKSRDWHQEFLDLDEGFRAGRISQYIGMPDTPINPKKKGRKSNEQLTPEYKKWVRLKRIILAQNRETENAEGVLQKQAQIDQMDLEIALSEGIDEGERQSKLEELDARIAELKGLEKKLSGNESRRYMFVDDDRRAFEMDPPLLMWDRRSAEPLIAEEGDFQHPQEVALLDFQTKPDLDIPPTTEEQNTYYDILASALLGPKGFHTAEQLNRVGPGLYQTLVKNAPSLRDPLKGGRRDIESVRARTMTPEMLRELAVAWDEWPFKPLLTDMLHQNSQMVVDMTRNGGPAATVRN